MKDLLNKSLDNLLEGLFVPLDIQMFAYSDTHYTYWYDLGTGQYRFYFVLTETVNIPANTSSLAVKGYIQIDIGSESSIAFSTLSFASSINGSYTNSSQKSKTFTSSSSYLIGTITHTITHNADGTKSVSWRGRGRPYYSSTSWDAYTSTQTVNLETIPRYATISSFTLSNQTLSTCDYAWATDVTCDQMQYSLNGGAWVTSGDSGTSDSGTISGLNVGVSNSVKIRVRRTDSQLYTESSIVYITTLQKGLLTNSANWNDEENPVISFTNINSQDLTFRIEAGGSTIVTRDVGTLASGDYTFDDLSDAERNTLRALITTNINSLTTRFVVATKVSGIETYWSYADKIMSLINYNPTFLDYAYEDTNANSLIMTGDSSVLINGISNVKTTISSGNKMVANKQATAVKYRTNIGTQSSEVNYSTSGVDMTINTVDAGIIYVSAIDSRGNLTQVIKTATIKAHATPIITELKFERQNGISSTVNVIGSGTYTNEDYGDHTNTIAKIEYSINNVDWTDITSKFDISGGTFANKSSGNTLTGFTVGTEYTLYFRVSDGYNTYILSTALSGGSLSSGEPILDLNKTKKAIGIGCISETANQLDVAYNSVFKANIKKRISEVDYDLLTAESLGDATVDDFDYLHADVRNQFDLGWILANETWAFVSTDDPTGVFKVNADVTTKYSLGMRIKLTNGGNIIFGKITKIGTYGGDSAGYTYITFLHEINPSNSLALYLLANSAITSNYYSLVQIPFGFPTQIEKWTIYYSSISVVSQSTPTINVWYNIDNRKLDLQPGSWLVSYSVPPDVLMNTGVYTFAFYTTLSTANNTANTSLMCGTQQVGSANYMEVSHDSNVLPISVTVKTPLYLNMRSLYSTTNRLRFGAWKTFRIQAVCVY